MFFHTPFSKTNWNKVSFRIQLARIRQVLLLLVFLTSLVGMPTHTVKADTPTGKYDWNLINVYADNYFSDTFLPINTIDDNTANMWFNAIDDTLPTSIWYEFPAV